MLIPFAFLASAAIVGGGGPSPTKTFDFTLGSLPSGVTSANTTLGMVADSTGKLTWCPNNLEPYSGDFSDATWTKGDCTVTANAVTGPFGGTTGDAVIPSAGSALAYVKSPFISVLTSQRGIWAAYVKNGTLGTNWIQAVAASGTAWRAWFDLSTGAAGTTAGSPIASGITSVGSGWYRIWIVVLATTSAPDFYLIASPSDGSTGNVTGDGTSPAFYADAAQVEAVTYQTSPRAYNATTSSAYFGPRLDYDPSTLAAKGLLIEPAATNLVLQSGNLADATAWSSVGVTATANSIASPDGTTNAALLTESSGSGNHFRYTTTAPDVSGSNNKALSGWIKAGTRRYVQMSLGPIGSGATNCIGVVVDTTTMTISGTGAGSGGTYVSSSIEDWGNGWYRVKLVGVIATNQGYHAFAGTDSSSFSVNPQSSGSQTFYAYGAQVENDSNAVTSYIPATTAAVTRAADVASTTDVTALAAQGFVVETGELLQSATATLLGANSIIGLGKTSGNALTTADGGTQTTGNTATWTGVNKSGIAFDSTPRVSISLNGGTVTTAANTPATLTALYFGSTGGSSAFITGHIRKVSCYATLTDAELQGATT